MINSSKTIGLMAILCLVIIAFSSQASAIFPGYDYDKTANSVMIKDNLGFTDVAKIELISNTGSCLTNCEAIIKITSYKELKTDTKDYAIKFLDKYNSDKSLMNVEILKQVTTQQTDTVDDYGKCEFVNKTTYDCVIGNHKETHDVTSWIPVDFSKETFKSDEPIYIKIKAQKGFSDKIDWQPVFYGQQIKEMAWWNATFAYKKAIFINQTNGSTLTDFTVPVTIDTATLITAGKMQSNCSDLRIVNQTETAEYNYWIQDGSCNNDSTIVMFRCLT
jgi:hypothetical protein